MVTERVSDPLRGLADPTRWQIVERLSGGGLPVSEIAEGFPMSRPAISKHLRVLRLAGLVVERKEGRHRIYELVAEPLEEIARRLERLASGAGARRGWIVTGRLSDAVEAGEVAEPETAEGVAAEPAAEAATDDDRWRSW